MEANVVEAGILVLRRSHAFGRCAAGTDGKILGAEVIF